MTVGKHVLVEDKDSGAFDIPAVVMSISDTGRSARVKRSDTNVSLLRNSKGIKIDPHFVTPVIVGSVNGLSPPGGDGELGDTSQDRGDTSRAKKSVTFSDNNMVGYFHTVGWMDEQGKTRRIGVVCCRGGTAAPPYKFGVDLVSPFGVDLPTYLPTYQIWESRCTL